MQSFKKVVISSSRRGAIQGLSTTTVSNGFLGCSSIRTGSIFKHPFSTSTPSAAAAQEGGGFFKSFFGNKVELQHAPHKEVIIK